MSDYLPVERFLGSVKDQAGAMLLDSGSHEYGLGEYSIFVANPVKEIVSIGDTRESRGGGSVETCEGDPFEFFRKELAVDTRREPLPHGLPFSGGAVGYFSYDLGRRLKESTLNPGCDGTQPDYRFGIYDAALVWDHRERELYSVVDASSLDPEASLLRLEKIFESASELSHSETFKVGELKSNFTRESYLDRIKKIRDYILEGEIYQANFSQQFSASFDGDGIELYRRLRKTNPAPYSAYLNFGDEEILSSSPERFLKLENRMVNTRPIKGTRPRGRDKREESRFRNELANSEKDRAELLMIVDLERNDLGRVCTPGTIEVKDLFRLETYASVIHQTATVEGRLDEEKDALDCIESMFPGGSITGAPKIRAMEVINELERGDRGVYTGSIGYLGFDGRADLNIAIRTMRIRNQEIAFNVGGGIVWDSDPVSEYDETLLKAKALFKAMNKEVGDVEKSHS